MPSFIRRRLLGASAAAACLPLTPVFASAPNIRHLGVFSLLGNSVRVVARQTDEVMFKDVGMDDIVFTAAENALKMAQPQALVTRHTPDEQISVQDQLSIGAAFGRRGDMPRWMEKIVDSAKLSHVLLVSSDTGAMEFRQGRTQVVGSQRVTGIGFYVSADGRTTGADGAISSGYLAPFAQMRVSLVDATNGKPVHSEVLAQGYIVGPPVNEAPDPWHFMNRAQKATALQELLKDNMARGMDAVLKSR